VAKVWSKTDLDGERFCEEPLLSYSSIADNLTLEGSHFAEELHHQQEIIWNRQRYSTLPPL
jgi:hypothetical protein